MIIERSNLFKDLNLTGIVWEFDPHTFEISIYSYNCTKNERSFFVQYLTLETFHEKKGKNQSNYIALESIIPSKFNSTPPLFTHSAIALAECVRRNKKE